MCPRLLGRSEAIRLTAEPSVGTLPKKTGPRSGDRGPSGQQPPSPRLHQVRVKRWGRQMGACTPAQQRSPGSHHPHINITGRSLQPAHLWSAASAPDFCLLLHLEHNSRAFFLPPRLIISLDSTHMLSNTNYSTFTIKILNICSISANRWQPQERKGTLSILAKDPLL